VKVKLPFAEEGKEKREELGFLFFLPSCSGGEREKGKWEKKKEERRNLPLSIHPFKGKEGGGRTRREEKKGGGVGRTAATTAFCTNAGQKVWREKKKPKKKDGPHTGTPLFREREWGGKKVILRASITTPLPTEEKGGGGGKKKKGKEKKGGSCPGFFSENQMGEKEGE